MAAQRESSTRSQTAADFIPQTTDKCASRTLQQMNSDTMNSPSSTASVDNSETPEFQAQTELDDELQLQFAPPSGLFVTEPASPETQYRDAPFQFATAPMDHLEALDSFDFFPSKQQTKKQPMASPSSPSAALEVPVKEGWDSVFCSAFPTFPSTAKPEKIMAVLQHALEPFECVVRVENRWTLRVSWLCVGEEVAFRVSLMQEQGASPKYEVAFHQETGDEAVFHQLVECVRARCSEVDAEPLFFAETTLEPWLDAAQDLKGRRYAISDSEAVQLIKEMNAQLDADTLYEVAKAVKNHCRHRGNRRLFLETDRSGFVQALKWMLADSEVLARFAVFILLQYAKESSDGESVDLFSSAFERNSVELLLADLETREKDSTCSQFTVPMLTKIHRSGLFA